LKKQFPESSIKLLCKKIPATLVKGIPGIVVVSDWNELKTRYDLMVDLRGSWKSIGFAFRNRPKVRLDRGTVRMRNKIKGGHPHEVLTNIQVIEPVLDEANKTEIPRLVFTVNELQKASTYLADHHIRSFAVLHTGARRMLRKWPRENFAALAVYLKEKLHVDIIFCGDASDLQDIEMIRQMISFNTFSIANDFSLREFGAMVSKASLFVGNESGPLHIAAVAGAPSLGLFGPGEPHVFYPYGSRTGYLHHVLACNPCDQIHCVHPELPCIRRITVEEVKSKVSELVNRKVN